MLLSEEVVKILREVGCFEFSELESTSILFPYVFEVRQTVDVVDEVEELLVLGIVVEWDDRNAVIKLKAKRVHGVVDNNEVFETAILDDA